MRKRVKPVAIRRRLFGFAVCALALCLSGLAEVPASAAMITLSFSNITNNDPTDAATGEAQLFVDVTDVGVDLDQVKFVFRNIGPDASSITDVYFDDGTLLGIADIINGSGVAFSQGATPGELVGANNISPPFETTAGFSADSDSPVQANGINPNEFLEIVFDLINNQTYASVLDSLDLGGAAGGLRIGIKVQGFAGGGSEGFVNEPPDGGGGGIVPEPSSMTLCAFAMLSLAGYGRFRRKLAVG
jgi:hypothetical protein